MLLIIDLNGRMSGPTLGAMSYQVAHYLGESVKEVLLISLLPMGLMPLGDALRVQESSVVVNTCSPTNHASYNSSSASNSLSGATMVVSVKELAAIEVGKGRVITAQPLTEIATKGIQRYYLPLLPNDNYNSYAEQLLHAVGLFSDSHHQYALEEWRNTTTEWEGALVEIEAGWQDQGPVVIIPPADPVLALFMGHAITHYLSSDHALVEESLYVMTSPLPLSDHTPPFPLQLTEWD